MRSTLPLLCLVISISFFATLSCGVRTAHAQEADIQVVTSVVDGYGEITYVKDRLIVGFRDDVPAKSRAGLATRYQAARRIPLDLIQGELWELSVDAGSVDAMMRDIAGDPLVAFVQPDIVYQLPAVKRSYERKGDDDDGNDGSGGSDVNNGNDFGTFGDDAGRGDLSNEGNMRNEGSMSSQGSMRNEGSMRNKSDMSSQGNMRNEGSMRSESDITGPRRPDIRQNGIHINPNPQTTPAGAGLEAVFPNDSQFNSLWGLRNYGQSGGTAGADISATDAWEVTTGSDEVIIAVLDSGVDYNHPDLNGNMWQDANGNYGYDFVNNDSNPMDTDGHGTHVAGTVAAVGNNGTGVTGVMWNAKIMAVRVCGSFGCPQSSITQGLSYAIQNGAKISNNSYGSSPTSSGPPPAYNSALQNALNNDHLFVVASGNDNNNNDILNVYPANMMEYFDNVISVGNSTRFDTRSSSSNYGSETVHLFAPGSDILSTVPGSSYATFSGTSMASPHVAGAAGLLLAAYPNAGYDDLKQWLLDGVDTPSSFNNLAVTNGRMNLFNAISSQNAVIGLSADSLGWVLDAGETANSTLSVNNNGLNNLEVTVSDVNVNSGSFLSNAALDVSFRAEEGFATGSIHEQAGWTAALGERGSSVLIPHTPLSPIVDDAFSFTGGQSLHLPNVSTQINNKIFYAFSPVFELSQQEGTTVVEIDFRITNTGGADYGFSLVDEASGTFLATMVWNYEGNLVFSNGGSDSIVGSWTGSEEWQSLKMAYTIGGYLSVFLNQQEVWSADAPSGNTGDITQLALFSDNWHAGETAHFDNVRVYRDGGTPAWLSYTPTSASIPAGGSASISVSVDAGAMSGGTYQRLLRFTSNDFATPVVDVMLTVEVMQDTRDYAFMLTIADALPNDIELTIGSAPDATSAYSEQYDRLAPPPPPDGAFDGRLVVSNTSYFEKILPTLTDQNEENQWEIRFAPSSGNAPVTITWDPAMLPQDDTAFRLTDVVGGLFVDLNLRTASSLVVEEVFIDKLYLTHTPGGTQTVEQSYSDKWNMVSLPVNQPHDGYSEIFPGTLTESLYSYSGSYVQESTLSPGAGYWLNFTSPQTVAFEGDAVNELALSLSENWNLIGSLTSAAVISDPDGVVVPGSVYRFDGSYIPVTELEPGLGFWVAASAAGDVTLQPGGAGNLAGAEGGTQEAQAHGDSERSSSNEHPVWKELNRETFHRITFAEVSEGESRRVLRELFFGGDVPGSGVHPLMISLPPVPPSGAFDARLEGGRWIHSGDEALVLVQQGTSGSASGSGSSSGSGSGEQQVQRYVSIVPGGSSVASANGLASEGTPSETKVSLGAAAVTATSEAAISLGAASEATTSDEAYVQYHIILKQNGLEIGRQTVQAGESLLLPADADVLVVTAGDTDGHHDEGLIPTEELPSVVALAQNYPNPFNPSTFIRFELPATQLVSLDVFDLSGRQIATLAEGVHNAGSHEILFDASSLASGVYLYRLQTETRTITRKFTLLK